MSNRGSRTKPRSDLLRGYLDVLPCKMQVHGSKKAELWLFEVSSIGNLHFIALQRQESSSKSDNVDLANFTTFSPKNFAVQA